MEPLESRLLLALNVLDMNSVTAMQLAQSLMGSQGTITSASYTGWEESLGSFSGGLSEGIGIDSGVILTTGKVSNAPGPNNDDNAGFYIEGPGDWDLDYLMGDYSSRDAAVLEFDIIPSSSLLSFQYVFASEDYNEYVYEGRNDAFGLFLGEGESKDNIAFVVTDMDGYIIYEPISVYTINQEWHSEYFVNNDYGDFEGQPPYPIQYDGFTDVLYAMAEVGMGNSVHVKLVIGDSGSYNGDSAVFLAGSAIVNPEPDLSLTKMASVDTAPPWEPFTYTLTAMNTSSTDTATDVTVMDTLPPGIFYLDSSVPQGTAEFNNGTFTANLGTLEPGQSVTMTITAYAGMSGWHINTATVSANEPDPNPANNTASDELYIPYAISGVEGTVWYDANGSGTRDEGEPGLGGVTMYLDLNQNHSWEDNEPMTVTSEDISETEEVDEGGWYSFSELYPGNYAVGTVLPPGYWLTREPEPFTLDEEEWATEKDFGMTNQYYYYTGSIEGTVWYDTDGDGTWDKGESGIPGVKVYLDLNQNGKLDGEEPWTMTESDDSELNEPGRYAFYELYPDDYTVKAILPTGYSLTRAPGRFTLDPEEWAAGKNFGMTIALAKIDSIAGMVFCDTNGNGSQDSGGATPETGMPGVTVYLDTNKNGAWDNGEPSTLSASNGGYAFVGLTPGATYVVRELVPFGYKQTAGTYTVTLDVNPLNSLHFGNQPVTTELSGTVFVDANGSGTRDGAADAGMAGVTVYLDENNNGARDGEERSTSTAADGSYAFTELMPGTSFVVRQDVPFGYQQTLGTYPVTMGVEPRVNLDFGNQPLTTELSGVIFLDANGNGARDSADEAGMAGVTVYLDANGNGTLDSGERSTTAGADGSYRFLELTPKGTYTVRELTPAGYLPTSGPYTITLGTAPADNLNFGNKPKATGVSGIKFLDANGNGILDGGLIVGPQPDVVFMVDISGSTILDFEGSPVGDRNGDKKSNTILDAQIAAFLALNQQLIEQGFGTTAKVAIVAFETVAANLDMDPSSPGIQMYTYPLADADEDGILDVAQALASLRPTGGTNYEAALQAAMTAISAMGMTAGSGNVIFLSDGYPNSENYLDDIAALQNLGIANIRAFGVGMSAKLETLENIDPSGAQIFTSADELLDVFSSAGENGGISAYSETILAGITIYADLNGNGSLDANEPRTQTKPDGSYTLGGLTAGTTYTIREIVPDGYIQTSGPYSLVLGVDPSENLNFGNQPDGLSIAGMAFYDANANGQFDSESETGMPGVTVYLDSNNNGYRDGAEPFQTVGADGLFAFTDLTFGYTYAVREIVPEGYVQTAGPYSVQVGIAPSMTLRMGNAQQPDESPETDPISGYAFNDADSNALRSAEEGMGGVTIYLDLNNNGSRDPGEPARLTAPDGSYSFTDLKAGQVCTVRQITPAGYQQISGPYTIVVGDNIPMMPLDFGNRPLTGEHPSLVAKSLTFSGHGIVVPGDKIDLSFVFANEGNLLAAGPVNVYFYASADGVLDAEDRPLGNILHEMVNLAPQELSNPFLLKNYVVPADLPPGNVTLFAKVEPADSSIPDDLALNNAVSAMMDVRWRFGSWDDNGDGVLDRKNVCLTVRDADGTITKFSLKNKGYGELDDPAFNLLSLYQTSLKSKVAIKTTDGSAEGTVIQNITADGDVGSFQAAGTSLGNSFTAAGAVAKLRLHDVAAANHQLSMNIGASLESMKNGCSLKFHRIQNLTFSSLSPMDSFVFAEWLDTGSPDTLFAPSIRILESKGDAKNQIDGHFEADVMITDSSSLLSKLTVNGLLNGSSIRTPGSIDAVKLGAALDSFLFAGIQSGVSSLPSSPDQISNPGSSIGSILIGGKKTIGDFLGSSNAHSFENTLIGANDIESLTLNGVQRDNGELEHGVAANAIASMKVTQPDGQSYVWDSAANSWKTQPAGGWQDFEVNILDSI